MKAKIVLLNVVAISLENQPFFFSLVKKITCQYSRVDYNFDNPIILTFDY